MTAARFRLESPMSRLLKGLALALAASLAIAAPATAAVTPPVGERHLAATNSTAGLRDAEEAPLVRVVVWYPAQSGAGQHRIDIGPPDKPLFRVGEVAPDAAFADNKARPVILLSHGFGGTARIMGWFGTALARQGYIVIAVDHPGNNGRDKMTVAGAIMPWTRAQDLAAALERVKQEPTIAPHMDLNRVGVAGFSAGGFTALISAGAKVDMNRFLAFCRKHPDDGVCAPQKEFAVTIDEAQAALASPHLAAEAAHAGDDHTIPAVKAAFAMAPAIVQALPPEGLLRMKVPVAIVLGGDDPVAPPETNGLFAAKAIPHAQLKVLPGVGHYDFLATCTPEGQAEVPICKDKVPQDKTHKAAIDMAVSFFDKTLGKPGT
jgi:predicted dienelactone hydrolase